MFKKEISIHIKNYQINGYTILENFISESQMTSLRNKYHELNKCSLILGSPATWFGNLLEHAPALVWPIVRHSQVLDILQAVMGPFVQLDNVTLAVFPSVSSEDAAGKVNGWHRDRWANHPNGNYCRPLAANAISYFQDLTDEYGPFRVIPKSHIDPVEICPDSRDKPDPREVVIHLKAGDLIITHNNLIHSGTPNTSGKPRYFFSVYYNHLWLKTSDSFVGPSCKSLATKARMENDLRALRLLGVDDEFSARSNWGFLSKEESKWANWIDSDLR